MLDSISRALFAIALLAVSTAHGAEVIPLPPIAPDDVEHLTISQLDTRAGAGDLKAQAELGARYARGADVAVDLPKAISLFRRASNKNDASGQYYLATAYVTGTGVKQDAAQAARLFRKAADQGHAGGQYSLGVMMATGEGGLKADPKRAAAYVLKSAEQGFILAAFRMAQLHIAGLGVARDPEQAAHWYRRVIETNGYFPASVGLRVLIETREVKWQPGDPGAPMPAEDRPVEQKEAAVLAPLGQGPLTAAPPDNAVSSLAPEPETTTTFKTDHGPTIEARTRAGVFTLFSTSDKPYHCEIDIQFTFLDAAGKRQEGRFLCFNGPRPAGENIQICEAAHRNFVQTKVEKVELLKCETPEAK